MKLLSVAEVQIEFKLSLMKEIEIKDDVAFIIS